MAHILYFLPLLPVVLYYLLQMSLFKKRWDPKNLHCYVTGGSTGLGHALAILLTRKGAHVSIVARNRERLDKALAEIEAARQNPNQILQAFSFSLDNAKDSEDALVAACEAHGRRAPDAVFTCAGSAKPMYFAEMTERDLSEGMVNGYWVQAWTAFASAKQMIRDGVHGKIVFISSTLGFMSIIGYSSYSPPKHALRALADSLRSEFLLYSIDVHAFFPCAMYTPGYEVENQTKPKITLEIESTDEGLTAEQAAQRLFRGVERGQTHIAADLLTNIFRAGTRGATPKNNLFVDGFYDLISFIGVPIWASGVDKKIIAHAKEHRAYLHQKGFFTPLSSS